MTKTLLRALPVVVALVLGITEFLDPSPWQPGGFQTILLPLLTVGYLVFGAVRGQLRRPEVLRLQAIGMLGFGLVAVLTVLLEPEIGRYVAASGWVAHAGWDYIHRHGRIVPRSYVEFCIVYDLFLAAAILLVPLPW